MNTAYLDNGDSKSVFSSDLEPGYFQGETKAHLQVEHELELGQLQIRFTFDQRGELEEKSIEYLAMQRTSLEDLCTKDAENNTTR